MITRTAATDRVRTLREAALAALATERVSLDAIAGRTLAADVVAEADLPAHDHATMDGFAFDATDEYPLELREVEVYPEDDPPSIAPGQAVRIATGAALPPEATAVLRREDATVEDGFLSGTAVDPGTYTYERASNVASGERLFAAGERLSSKDAILLRDLGIESVEVRERFSVGVLATGTEIHEGRQTDLDSPMLAGLVRAWGGEATYEGSVPDDPDRVTARVRDLAERHDVVVTSGGTSVGRKDHVVRALSDLGEVDFHRVRLRPGKPIAAARLPDQDAHAFAIPGKPVGAHTVAVLVMRPFFVGESSPGPSGDPLPTVDAELARDLAIGPEGFEYAVPVLLDDGEAMPLGHADSPLQVYDDTFDPSVLSSSTRATRADGFFLAESDCDAGETVRVVPYDAVE